MPTHLELTEEFTVTVFNEELGFNIPLCGLCANTGILDTTNSAVWGKHKVGIKTYCVCLNGRAMKRRKIDLSVY